MNEAETQHLFRKLILTPQAVRDGHYSFGERYHSRFFVDFGRVLQYPSASVEIVKLLFEPYKTHSVSIVVTPNSADGAILASGVAEKFNSRVVRALRSNGVVTLPEHCELSSSDVVLLVDDAVNTGNSMRQLVARIADSGAVCCGISVCVSRYAGEQGSLGVEVRHVFDLSKQYPLLHVTQSGCLECDRLALVGRQLRDETETSEQTRLMKEKVALTLRSAYSDAQN